MQARKNLEDFWMDKKSISTLTMAHFQKNLCQISGIFENPDNKDTGTLNGYYFSTCYLIYLQDSSLLYDLS